MRLSKAGLSTGLDSGVESSDEEDEDEDTVLFCGRRIA